MDAVQAAAEATTNGAEAAAPAAQTGLSLVAKITNVSGNLGVSLLGVSLSGIGVGIALSSAKAALKAAKA